jgi:LmbE family N-acetylglucosaminyl deacetylase
LTDKIHRARGFPDGIDYVSARRGEDQAAAAILGTRIEWGGSLDAIYRNSKHYNRSATLLGPPAPGDPLVREASTLIDDLRRRFPRASLYAPMGVGGHIDHRGVSAAARMAGGNVCLYEEFPHRGFPGTEPPTGKPELVHIASRFVDVWVNAVLCYRSQLGPLFGGEDATRAAVIAHAESTGGTRIWRI